MSATDGLPVWSWVLLIVAGLYVLVCLLMLMVQERFVFFPERRLQATPADLGLEFRDVTFQATDGVELHGWLVAARPERAVVIHCHGNAGNIGDRLETVRLYHEMGLTVLLFDYRGYGRSRGRPTEAGTYRDAMGAWRFLTRQEGVDPERIILVGRSLGGAVAIELATRVQPAALVAEATFTSAGELGARHYPLLPVRWISRIRYDSLGRIGRIRVPKLIVHSTGDEVVPFTMALKLHRAAAGPVDLLKIRGGHNDGFLLSEDRYRRGLEKFLTGVLKSTLPNQ